jgi:glycine cleavage system protein P-like pyridoxal-binding family
MRTLKELVYALKLQFLSTLYKTYAVESAADVIQGFFGAVNILPYSFVYFKTHGKAAKFREKAHQVVEFNQKSNIYMSS